jgi:hypothetical protein
MRRPNSSTNLMLDSGSRSRNHGPGTLRTGQGFSCNTQSNVVIRSVHADKSHEMKHLDDPQPQTRHAMIAKTMATRPSGTQRRSTLSRRSWRMACRRCCERREGRASMQYSASGSTVPSKGWSTRTSLTVHKDDGIILSMTMVRSCTMHFLSLRTRT